MKYRYWFILWLVFTYSSLTQVVFSEAEPNNNFVDALDVGEEKDIRGELTGTDIDLFN